MKIAVIGAGLSGLAAAWRMQQAGHEVVVFEAADRPGGRCGCVRRDGFIIDTGPELANGSYIRWQRLARDVGLGADIVNSSTMVAILRDGKAIDIDAASPLAMALTPALSWGAKLNIATALWRLRKTLQGVDGDNPLASADLDDPASNAEALALRYFGREAAQYLVDPLVRGIGGSRMGDTSALAVMLGLDALKQPLISLRGGLEALPRAVAARLDVRYRQRIDAIRANGQGVDIGHTDADGNHLTFTAERCLIATQFDDAAKLYPRFAELGRDFLRDLGFAQLLDIKLAYSRPTRSRASIVQVPPVEEPDILMITLPHNKAPDRAPPGHSLVGVFSDNSAYARLSVLSDADAVAWARGHAEKLYPELAGHLLFSNVMRQPRTINFIGPGYFRNTRTLWDAIGHEPRVHLGGDLFGAGSMEAAVMGGERAADRMIGG